MTNTPKGAAWLFAPGKGGAGASTIAAGVACALADEGRTVCLIDTTLGMRSLDLMLGLENRVVYDVTDVLSHQCTVEDALLSPADYPTLSLLPAAQFCTRAVLDSAAFTTLLRKLKAQFDFVLIDAPSGAGDSFRALINREIDECAIVLSPDDLSIRCSERIIAMLEEARLSYAKGSKTRFPRPQVIVNRLDSDLISQGEMYPAQVVAQTLDLPLLGEIPEEPLLYRALLRHVAPIALASEGQQAICRTASRISGHDDPLPAYGSRKPGLMKRLFRPHIQEVNSL